MSQFVYAQFQIHDKAGYEVYVGLATPIFLREKVKIHASDNAPQPITPDMKADKSVLLEFRDEAHMAHFFALPDYMEAAKHRDAAAKISAIRFKRFTP